MRDVPKTTHKGMESGRLFLERQTSLGEPHPHSTQTSRDDFKATDLPPAVRRQDAPLLALRRTRPRLRLRDRGGRPPPGVQVVRAAPAQAHRRARAHARRARDRRAQLDRGLLGAAAASHAGELEARDDHAAATRGILSRDEALNFDRDGEARYFGLASGRLELSREGDEAGGGVGADGAALRPNRFYQEVVNEWLVPEELEEELVGLYFRWDQPWLQVVDEKLFRESRACGGKYFSPLLLNCIMAVGSRFSARPETRADPDDVHSAGGLFLEKAEILLHYDLKWPSITTLQSLCILGSVKCVSVGVQLPCMIRSADNVREPAQMRPAGCMLVWPSDLRWTWG